MARHRRRWRVWQRYMDADRFVFLDETGATTSMTRRYGWGERGERLVDAAPYGPWKTTTFVAGLRASGIIAPFVLDGPMNGEAFRVYVEQVLAPVSSRTRSAPGPCSAATPASGGGCGRYPDGPVRRPSATFLCDKPSRRSVVQMVEM